ncbi:hypothetical protein IE81DRAFT_321582 [Ceraceosorus guamensis]|uniref:NAD(P)-binding protein n=1 Tax=Ceraceosorus guamensis TaxID=1522189 RepID=A0A316W805_9BASI|nr:hypothetical protein IE81DRAFT_321582 [Ceraceosorus guamensis]PWN44183.1 hypothetical protein IE81DRAFT_321582 [Ceraceosorus guamensis]
MTDSLPSEVNVLILGGVTHLARPLLAWLLSDEPARLGGPTVKHVRMVDKFLIAKEGSSTFVDPPTIAAISDARVEYQQANLNIPATAARVFEPSASGPFDFAFDLTGEGIVSSDVPAQLLLERTVKLAGSLAALAQKAGVKAYVRDTPPFWKSKVDEGLIQESSDVSKRSLPKGPRAYFYYEAERAVASIEGLPAAILRSAGVWGPAQYHGELPPRLALGEVYRIEKEPIKILWSGDLRLNTLHSQDWCTAAWSVARWLAQRDRAAADSQAGEKLPAISPRDKGKGLNVEWNQDLPNCCPRAKVPTVPVFNVADDEDTNQQKLLDAIGSFFGVETGFVNAAINAWAKLNLSSVVDEMNEKHSEMVAKIMAQTEITSTPFTLFLDTEAVAQRTIALETTKIKNVIGWKPARRLDDSGFEEMISSFQDAGVWAKNR